MRNKGANRWEEMDRHDARAKRCEALAETEGIWSQSLTLYEKKTKSETVACSRSCVQ